MFKEVWKMLPLGFKITWIALALFGLTIAGLAAAALLKYATSA